MQHKISAMQGLNVIFDAFVFLKMYCVEELLFKNVTISFRWLRSTRSIYLLSYNTMF
jgi:hypothetical protein